MTGCTNSLHAFMFPEITSKIKIVILHYRVVQQIDVDERMMKASKDASLDGWMDLLI